MEIERRIRDFLEQEGLVDTGRPFEDEDSFFEVGILDSLGVLRLMGFVEEQFGISIDDEDLRPENFDSVACVARFVRERLGAGAI